ncbi:MAG: hypothetical protein IPQ07_21860 [Myxococcales bacterium]|nr:hypothetical protein [Myxococcales bacterium]
MYLFAVGEAGAKSIAKRTVSIEDHDAMEKHLVARGLRLGATFGSNVFVWAFDDAGYAIWSNSCVVASGERESLSDVREVIRFDAPEDRGHRGVQVIRSSGQRETLVEEHDSAPEDMVTYGVDDLVHDSRWAKYLGLQLATWLAVPFVDQIQPSGRT